MKPLSPHFVEDRMRRRFSRRLDTEMEKRRFEIKDGVKGEFDFATRGGRIVGQVKTSGPRRSGPLKGQIRRQTSFGNLSSDCLLLAAMKKSRVRLLVLTNNTMFKEFRKSPQGKAAERLGVKIVRERI